MATGDERGAVTVYDAATRRPLGPAYLINGGLIQNVRFSPDGGALAISSMDPKDPQHNGLVDLIDARTQQRTLRVRLPRLPKPSSYVYADVVFPPNGRDLLVRQVPGEAPNGAASPVFRVDGKTGAVKDRLLVGEYASDFYASGTADRGRFFLTSQRDNRTWELDAERLRVKRSWPVGDLAGAVSPDGRAFALGSQAGRIRLLDLDSGQIRQLRGRHDTAVIRMRFTPDGRTLVTSAEQGQLFAWDVARGRIAQRFAGHTGDIDGLDLTGDGRTLITAGADARAILWDLAGDRRLDRRFAVGRRFDVFQTARGIAISPDGRTLALTHSDGAVDLIDTRTLRRRAGVRALDGIAASVAFSPDGRLLAVTGEGGRLTLWNARTLAPAGELRGMRGHSQALAFSPDGKLLAAAEGTDASDDGPRQPLRVWDVRRRTLTGFRGRTTADLIAFSPNGELIAAAGNFRGTDIRDARTGRLVKRMEVKDLSGQKDFSRSVKFSPDGDLLFVGQFNGTGRLFSTKTWKPVGRPLEGHTARITFPEFTPDGRRLITAAADGTVVLWDVATQKPIGAPLALESNTWDLRRPQPRRLAPVRHLHPGRGNQLRHVPRGLEAPRLPGRGARAHHGRVERGVARAALPVGLPGRLTSLTGAVTGDGRSVGGQLPLERTLHSIDRTWRSPTERSGDVLRRKQKEPDHRPGWRGPRERAGRLRCVGGSGLPGPALARRRRRSPRRRRPAARR